MTAEEERIVYSLAPRFFWPGAEPEDVRQEARIAILEARRTYDSARGSWFSYAWQAVYYRLVEIVRRERERRPVCVGDAPLYFIPSRESRDTTNWILDVRAAWPTLSPLEQTGIRGVINGTPYADMPGGQKRVDNAVQRGRRKLAA